MHKDWPMPTPEEIHRLVQEAELEERAKLQRIRYSLTYRNRLRRRWRNWYDQNRYWIYWHTTYTERLGRAWDVLRGKDEWQ